MQSFPPFYAKFRAFLFLGQAATEMFVQPGTAVFFTHDFAVHALRLRQPVIWRSLGNGRQ